MATMVNREQEQLWEAVELLSSIDKEKAEIVLKTTIEKSLQLMNLYTPIISTAHFSIPDEKYLEQLKKLDSKIQGDFSKSASEKTYEIVVEYIQMLGNLSKEPTLTSNKILASILARHDRGKTLPHFQDQLKKIITFKKEEIRYYTPNEVSKKLGLSDQTIRRMCEKGSFQGAYKTEGGHWKIPEDIFITTREQDEKAEEVLKQIDRKNSKAGDVDEFDL